MLLAVCNAKYEFIMVDIGDSGRQSGGSAYNNSQLRFPMKVMLLTFQIQILLSQTQKMYWPMFLLLMLHLGLNVTR